MRLVQKKDVRDSDLWMSAVYEGGPSLSDEPIHLILGTQNMKGIRPKRQVDGKTAFIALHSTADEIEWPDSMDHSTGIYTYYGDNRTVGNGLLSSDGNKAIERIFSSDFDTKEGRLTIPPFLFFLQWMVLQLGLFSLRDWQCRALVAHKKIGVFQNFSRVQQENFIIFSSS